MPRYKVHFFDEIHIEQAYRTASTALGLKVVDDGYFNAIEVELIFRWSSAANNHIVPKTRDADYAWQTLNDFGNIPVSTWVAFNFANTEFL